MPSRPSPIDRNSACDPFPQGNPNATQNRKLLTSPAPKPLKQPIKNLAEKPKAQYKCPPIIYPILNSSMNQLFDHLDNVNVQVQHKRRQNNLDGMWGAPLDLLNGLGGGLGGNQIGQGLWGGNNMMASLGLEMTLMANRGLWGNNIDGVEWVKEQEKRQAYNIVASGQARNLVGSDIEDRQITFLEPSPAMQKLQELKRTGKVFEDTRFPPTFQSLVGDNTDKEQKFSQIKWKRISEILPNAQIFKNKVEPNDIRQGQLGHCYFLAGLAALAERPDRIFNLFLLREVNSVRYYSVKLLYKGKWMTIDMDEFLPTLNNQPAFSYSVDKELWVMLLEKAWAKLYKSYARIEAGLAEEALHDLTGAPIKTISFKQNFNKEAEWKYLLMASQKEYSMVCSSRDGSDTQTSPTGIVLGHAYTFLNATVLNGSERVVQVRNPWGKTEYRGRWGDTDPNWNCISPAEKARVGYTNNPNDGIFFMTYDAFIQEFANISVAEINDNASYVYKSIKDPNMQGGYFKIEIVKAGYYSLQVDHTPFRNFKREVWDHYHTPITRIELARVNGGNCQRIETVMSAERTSSRGYQLTPGVYVAYVKLDFDRQFEKDFDINLAIYAEYVCDIELAPREMAVMMAGPSVRWNPAEHQQKKWEDWNNLGNQNYHQGDSGWRNFQVQPQGPQGGNQLQDLGWGNNIPNQNNNGWGNWEAPKKNNDNGWGNGGGWGDLGQDNKENQGWQNNHGQGHKKMDDGWGQNSWSGPTHNNGWGQQDSGWGQQESGWGQTPAQNNGWGQQPHQMESFQQHNNGWGGASW